MSINKLSSRPMHASTFWLLFVLVLNATHILAESSEFNPRHYTKTSATCPAVNREANNTSVDLTLTYVDINPTAKQTIVMLHGWPSLWSSWAYQIMEFKNDYRLIVPDIRGFGESTHPGDVKSSGTMYDLVGDVVCILENAKIANALCMGHDWGSQLCYEAARERPDIFHGVIGLVVPYLPAAGPFIQTKVLSAISPKLRYQVFFDTRTSEAVAELDKDIRRTIRATLRTKDSPPPDHYLTSDETFVGAYDHLSEIPPVPFFSEIEEDYFVEQYSIQGFENTLQFYMTQNRYATWKFANDQGNHTIPVPVLAVYPTDDPVADWVQAAQVFGSEKFLPLLTVEILPGAHWVHLEYPNLVNTAIRKWLKKIESTKPKSSDETSTIVKKVYDETAGTTRVVEDVPLQTQAVDHDEL